jgi:hypothetical protein
VTPFVVVGTPFIEPSACPPGHGLIAQWDWGKDVLVRAYVYYGWAGGWGQMFWATSLMLLATGLVDGAALCVAMIAFGVHGVLPGGVLIDSLPWMIVHVI